MMQTAETQIPPDIAASARAIHALQRQQEQTAKDLAAAEAFVGRCAQAWNLDRQQDIPEADRARSKQRLDDAHERATELRAQRRRLDEESYDRHVAHGELWRSRQVAQALGGHVLEPVSLPDWRTDARLSALNAKANELHTARATVIEASRDARMNLSAAEALMSTARIEAHLGRPTSNDVTRIQADAKRLAIKVEQLGREIGEIDEALAVLTREREALETELRSHVRPTLQSQYSTAVAEFIETLRAVVVKNERLWALLDALEQADALPQDCRPWAELRLQDDSKFRVFIAEAIKAGHSK